MHFPGAFSWSPIGSPQPPSYIYILLLLHHRWCTGAPVHPSSPPPTSLPWCGIYIYIYFTVCLLWVGPPLAANLAGAGRGLLFLAGNVYKCIYRMVSLPEDSLPGARVAQFLLSRCQAHTASDFGSGCSGHHLILLSDCLITVDAVHGVDTKKIGLKNS